MTAPPGYELNIITITVGDDFGATRTMNDIPNGQALAQATWTVKRLEDFAAPGDATAVWQKTITTADVANTGQIEDSGAITRTGRLRWDGTYLESLLSSLAASMCTTCRSCRPLGNSSRWNAACSSRTAKSPRVRSTP
jgi:hypothetical protein